MHPFCKIKLCGLRTEAEVDLAVALGVDAVGFVLTQSPRQIGEAVCRQLRVRVPSSITVHGVFAGDDPAEIRRLFHSCRLDVAQVHGAEGDASYWSALQDIAVIRAFRVRGEETMLLLEAVRGETFLLDAYVPGVPGGTGETFDWTLARDAAGYGRVILAGGLTPGNVADAIRVAQPWMVDVSGGIEKEKGVKDFEKMRAFVAAVRRGVRDDGASPFAEA